MRGGRCQWLGECYINILFPVIIYSNNVAIIPILFITLAAILLPSTMDQSVGLAKRIAALEQECPCHSVLCSPVLSVPLNTEH